MKSAITLCIVNKKTISPRDEINSIREGCNEFFGMLQFPLVSRVENTQ